MPSLPASSRRLAGSQPCRLRSATPGPPSSMGRTIASALTLAGFSIGMDGHDRARCIHRVGSGARHQSIIGADLHSWQRHSRVGRGSGTGTSNGASGACGSARSISWAFAAFDAQAMSHFLRGRYDEACHAAYKSVQANPAHSITYVQLAAALAKLGTAGRSQGGRRESAGTASHVSLRPPVCGRQLRACACGNPWRCAAGRRAPGVARC